MYSAKLPFTSLSFTGGVHNSNEPLKVIYSHASPPNGLVFSAHSSSLKQIYPAVTSGVLPQQGNKSLIMQPPLIIKQGANTGQVGKQPGRMTVPMTVNFSMPASIANVMALKKSGGQKVVVTTQNLGSAQPTILSNVQILNMRPGTPAVADQKTVATVSKRVVIGTPQVVGTRAPAPKTLQTLQNRQPGRQGHLLVKTKNGQYRLVRTGLAPSANTLTVPQTQTIRLSSVPQRTNRLYQTPAQPKPESTIAVLQNIPLHAATKINVNKVNSGGTKAMTVNSKANFPRSNVSSGLSTVLTPGRSLLKVEEKKTSFSQRFGDDKMAGDDDINDVAAMGGVNLAEESQRILGSSEMIGTQIRSCKEEYLVPLRLMQARIKSIVAKHNLDEPPPEVAGLLTHALQERLKNLIEKLAVIGQHRIDHIIKTDNRYEPTQDVKGQLKFLEEVDRVHKKRSEESEREMLLRAAKSRSKKEDPEQAKLKAKAKEMQRAELEELRQREANLTALQAIGPRKKPKLEGPGATGSSQKVSQTRFKRINQHDMMFLLEQERNTAHSLLLFKSYLK